MNSCLVFSIPRAGTHLVLKLLSLMGLKCRDECDEKAFLLPRSGCYCFTGHLAHTAERARRLSDSGLKGIYITRDLRDVIVSQARQGAILEDVPLTPRAITGAMEYVFAHQYRQQMPWKEHECVLHVTYEDLVGPEGGGSLSRQTITIAEITYFLGLVIGQDFLKRVRDKLYGGDNPKYFVTGKIGTWKRYFTDEHEERFKVLMRGVGANHD